MPMLQIHSSNER